MCKSLDVMAKVLDIPCPTYSIYYVVNPAKAGWWFKIPQEIYLGNQINQSVLESINSLGCQISSSGELARTLQFIVAVGHNIWEVTTVRCGQYKSTVDICIMRERIWITQKVRPIIWYLYIYLSAFCVYKGCVNNCAERNGKSWQSKQMQEASVARTLRKVTDTHVTLYICRC